MIERKLRRIEDFLRELRAVEVGSLEEFRGNVIAKRFIERNPELAIEQMIDICKHLVSGLDLREPETYPECFDVLSQAGVVSDQNAGVFKSMARFGNILIHAYEGVDESITFGIYEREVDRLRRIYR